ncbi:MULTISPECIES: cell division protein FtsA [Bacillaceae]|uniref:Pilus assembly protein PilM n=1 Tax=Evansella alkalicola TaxID=745819 RepID=A0ABS6JTT9_9BACI|nr:MULTISPECIES: pilus assembly protein PilM [Bacillaceae]MBU9721094.1 pilus assembly protein PilM [Bacillus alkalicola]
MDNQNGQAIFALDIGTRSVVGLILHKHDGKYHVIDMVREEHQERSMLDGQIHNVVAVSNVIKTIKDKLALKHGPLEKVCVAAAGRSLKTQRATAEVDIKGNPILEHQSVLHLELSAVQNAQFSLAQLRDSDKSSTDYCVGYSVMDYRIDGETIGSLIDQQGEKATVEVIATFLPRIVVESLITALQRAELELEALTLEPIAAIHVLIPPSMRRLNVALVDIGAGTSDIAITNLGTVVAYGMVPFAGDEITEAISDHFLLDFPDAEHLKREISTKEQVTITDILGFETEYSQDDVVEPVEDAIDELAKKISEEIINLNGKFPKAVMLVGGGSMTPKLPEKVAAHLELPSNRVAIRGIDAIKGLVFDTELESTPELVTPIGIAIAAKESPVQYISISVNDRPVRLFDIKDLTVGDGLLTSGLELSKLYGKPGMGLLVTVNGRVVSLPGKHGTPPALTKNGQVTELDDFIAHGDVLSVSSGKNGEDASATIGDFFKDYNKPLSFTITYNGVTHQVNPIITLNGRGATLETEVQDRDKIELFMPETLQDVLHSLNISIQEVSSRPLNIYIDGTKTSSEVITNSLLVNGNTALPSTPINPGDVIKYKAVNVKAILLKDVLPQNMELTREITVIFNHKKVNLKKAFIDVYRRNEKLSMDSHVFDGDELKTVKKEVEPFIFQDVFAVVDIERPSLPSKKPVILRNEQGTTFSEVIHHGDHLELKWID